MVKYPRRINWSDCPPDRPRMLQIVRAPYQGKAIYDVLSDQCFGVFMHWIEKDQRNQPCVAPHGCCCQIDNIPSHWKGYLACLPPSGGPVRLVEVTSQAWLDCRGVEATSKRGTLRGFVLELSRARGGKSGPVKVRLLDPPQPRLWVLPLAPNVRDELEAIWGSKLPRQ